jgi:hypothetical protein
MRQSENPYQAPATLSSPSTSLDSHSQVYACPKCGRGTSSLKRYDFPEVMYAVLFSQRESKTVTACPSCLRRYLLGWGTLSLFTANIKWPIAIAPLMICRFLASFRRGNNLGNTSVMKGVLGAFALIGLVAGCLATPLVLAILVLASPEIRPTLLMAFGGCIAALTVFGVLGALADV